MSALVTACVPGGDTSIYVRNDTAQPWYVSVPRENGESLWVVRVNPGADDFAVSWTGGREIPVSVLAPDCSVVGAFRKEGDGYVVDAVPGLTARMEDHGGPWTSRGDAGVDDTEDCGGFLYK